MKNSRTLITNQDHHHKARLPFEILAIQQGDPSWWEKYGCNARTPTANRTHGGADGGRGAEQYGDPC